MYINEETAQLILDVLAWSNADWSKIVGWSTDEFDVATSTRNDFVRFCKVRGIEGVEHKIVERIDE